MNQKMSNITTLRMKKRIIKVTLENSILTRYCKTKKNCKKCILVSKSDFSLGCGLASLKLLYVYSRIEHVNIYFR